MNLFKFLKDKNYWYSKYLSANEAYLQALFHAPDVALDELDLFYGNRESLLKIIESIDENIQLELEGEEWKVKVPSTGEKTLIQQYIRDKDSIIKKIVELDSKILVRMEELKAEGVEKIRALSKGKKALSGYRANLKDNDKLNKRV